MISSLASPPFAFAAQIPECKSEEAEVADHAPSRRATMLKQIPCEETHCHESAEGNATTQQSIEQDEPCMSSFANPLPGLSIEWLHNAAWSDKGSCCSVFQRMVNRGDIETLAQRTHAADWPFSSKLYCIIKKGFAIISAVSIETPCQSHI